MPLNIQLCILSDLEDVKPLCTNANAEELDDKLIPILPHLSELKMLSSTCCIHVNDLQLALNVDYRRKLWLDLLFIIVSYDPKPQPSPHTRKGKTLYGCDLKTRTYRSQDGGRRGGWAPEDGYVELLWPTSSRSGKACRCPVDCARRPYHSWPHLSPLATKCESK